MFDYLKIYCFSYKVSQMCNYFRARKDFTDARIAAARKEEDHAAQKASQPPKEAKPEVAAFIPWRARAQHKEEQQR